MLTIEEKENQAKLINRLGRIADSLERIANSLDKRLCPNEICSNFEDYVADLEADFELTRVD